MSTAVRVAAKRSKKDCKLTLLRTKAQHKLFSLPVLRKPMMAPGTPKAFGAVVALFLLFLPFSTKLPMQCHKSISNWLLGHPVLQDIGANLHFVPTGK